jgi:serine/threonine-protein kinase HipA
MFGRLALNTALQNTDDHLKNFGFLKRPGSPVQYEIAPVFDVSAQASARHYLHCLELGQIYSLDDILPLARRLGVAKAAADDIEQRIASVVAHSQDYLDAAGLPREQAHQVQAWIDAGCGPRLRQWRLAAQQGLSHAGDDVPTDDERAPVAPDRPA